MRSAVSSGSVSVVLANWNGGRYIGRCLDALMAQTRAVHEIVVVDNGSVDGSAEVIAKKYPDVTLLRRPLNEGTGRAWNLAIERSSGDYVLILNTDVFLDNARSYESARVQAYVGCAITGLGVAGLATGVVLLVRTRPEQRTGSHAKASVELQVRAGALVLSGRM